MSSHICELYCPVVADCADRFDAVSEHQGTLLAKVAQLEERKETLMEADTVELKEAALTHTRLMADMALGEGDIIQAAHGMVVLGEAKNTCSGPRLNLLGKLTMTFMTIRHWQRPSESEKLHVLSRRAKCSSHAAKTALHDMPTVKFL